MNEKPSTATAILERALSYRQAGRYREATELCLQGLRQAPDSAPHWHLLGLIQSDLGQFTDAIEMLDKALSLDSTQPGYFKALADTYSAMGDTDQAIENYQSALILKADYFEVHSNLGGVLLDTGRFDQAIGHYRKAIGLRPDIAELHDNLGNALRIGGYCESAIACHERALQLKPDLAAARVNIGSSLIKLGRHEEAVEILESALEGAADMPQTHLNLAVALSAGGSLDKALTHYQAASGLKPDYFEAVAGEAEVLTELGEYEAARQCLQPHAGARTRNSAIALAFSSLAADTDQQRDSIDNLQQLLACGKLNAEERRRIHFRLADLYDQTRCYDRAFEQCRQGNQLKPHHFNRSEYEQYIDKVIAVFSRRNLARLPTAVNNSELPVFIVGMPRSGKSLIEQILACHTQVTGAGELADVGDLVLSLEQRTGQPFPSHLEAISADQLNEFAELYLSKRQSEAFAGTLRVTDTMPFNVERLGFIGMLFPHARVIHCRRDPRDMLLECYCKDFAAGHSYANDLVTLGYRYHQYERLWRHWKNTLGLPQMDVDYEKLVRDPVTVSRQLIDFLGLTWQARCLNFHESANTRLTGRPSIRNPINQRSVGRWKNYEQALTPLIRTLQDP